MEQLQDIPKIYTAIAEWMSCLVIVLTYGGVSYIKEKMARRVSIMIVGFLALVTIHMFCGMVSGGLWLVGMAAAVSMMMLIITMELEVSLTTSIYMGCRAFLFAELVAAFNWQVYYYYFVVGDYSTKFRSHFFTAIIYFIAYGFFYKLETELLPEEIKKDDFSISRKQLLTFIVLTLLIFCLSNLSYANVNTPFSGSSNEIEIFNIRTLIDLAGFVILEAMFIQKMEDDRKKELDAIKNILYTQYVQYRTSQENIDVINRKYHDLKHQLQVIREENNQEKKNAYLDEIEEGIRKYEAENKTGNPVLDTILTSKSGFCLKHDIQLVSIVDGMLLNNIHVMDICTIFGNALDNAIEYELQIPERKKELFI